MKNFIRQIPPIARLGIPALIFTSITLAGNAAAIYATIQSFVLIPASLHWLTAIVGFILLLPFNITLITFALILSGLMYRILGGEL